MSYSAFSGMFVDVMPLFNHGYYILIKLLTLIGENAVLRDKMSFFHLHIEFCTYFLRDEASTFYLFSVYERMVIRDSYVNDSPSFIVAKRITGRVGNDRLCFSQYGCF